MKYHSTRHAHRVNFKRTLFNGIAENGGLYIPETIPEFDLSELFKKSIFCFGKKLVFNDIAFKVCRKFIDPEEIPDQDLKQIIKKSFKTFRIKSIAPLVKLNPNLFVLELFHGPTYAFKDIALQFLANVLQYFNKSKINIICATSGDTGAAAIYAVRYKSDIRCFVLHPKDSISSIQRAQMTSVLEPNIFNYEIEGSFDDCQKIVKILNASLPNTTTFNSINWCRIMVQITYYFYAYAQMVKQNHETKVSFSVPTGNFGDILAGFYAHKMGLPINKLIIATNENRTLFNFMKTGRLNCSQVVQTFSPAMDISMPSNIERLLYYFDYNYQTESISPDQLVELRKLFECESISNDMIIKTIRDVFDKYSYVIDPHTAVGIAASHRSLSVLEPVICLATAHPGKFPETMNLALNHHFIPNDLGKLLSKPQRYVTLHKSDALYKIKNDICQ